MKFFYKCCKTVGHGIIGIIVWPVATLLTLPRILKVIRDVDFPLKHILLPDHVADTICPDSVRWRLIRTRPDERALEQMKHRVIARYKTTYEFLEAQAFTLLGGIPFAIFGTPLFTFIILRAQDTAFFIKLSVGIISSFNILQSIYFSTNSEKVFLSAVDALIKPLQFCFTRYPRFFMQNIVLESACVSSNSSVIHSIVPNVTQGKLNAEISDLPKALSKKLEDIENVLRNATPFPDDVTNIILEYGFPLYLYYDNRLPQPKSLHDVKSSNNLNKTKEKNNTKINLASDDCVVNIFESSRLLP